MLSFVALGRCRHYERLAFILPSRMSGCNRFNTPIKWFAQLVQQEKVKAIFRCHAPPCHGDVNLNSCLIVQQQLDDEM